MLMAHPALLRNLLERYEALQVLVQEPVVAPRIHSHIQDVCYALCVATGTRNGEEAIAAARERLVATV